MDAPTLQMLAPRVLGHDITPERARELGEEIHLLCDAVAGQLHLLAYDDEPDDFLKILEENGHA